MKRFLLLAAGLLSMQFAFAHGDSALPLQTTLSNP